jgi:uncharacterized membrane protein YidH (DUF202 family)
MPKLICNSPALERTYLAYVRTSLALAVTGVTIAQLFRLAGSITPGQKPLAPGLPLAACFIISAMLVVLLGAVRFWRQQTAMARGKVWAGGFEILLIIALFVLVSLLFWPISRISFELILLKLAGLNCSLTYPNFS